MEHKIANPRKLVLQCRFHAQMWLDDDAVEVDPDGQDTWTIPPERTQALLSRHGEKLFRSSIESDDLRLDACAPPWCRYWSGPFWVEAALA